MVVGGLSPVTDGRHMTSSANNSIERETKAQATLSLSAYSSLHGLPWHLTTEEVCERARITGWELCSYSDPTDEGCESLTVEEAVSIAREDAGLIYLSRLAVLR